MGMRILNLVVASAGTGLFSVTVPPNANVCPAGWFLVFVVDINGMTPSIGQWIRIGGDPDSLHTWPSDPAFAPLPSN
jgi:hypothetical protein